jgi:hypothetical protein
LGLLKLRKILLFFGTSDFRPLNWRWLGCVYFLIVLLTVGTKCKRAGHMLLASMQSDGFIVNIFCSCNYFTW